MIDSIETINDIGVLFEKKIVLYGAGNEGKKTYSELKKAGISVAYFCDGNFERWGNRVADKVKIISPGQLRRLDGEEEIAIIISAQKSKFISEIAETLIDMGLRTNYILTAFGLRMCLVQNINNPRIGKEYRELHTRIFALQQQRKWMWYGMYFTDRMLSLLSQQISDSNLALLYQPGKVGSSTIAKGLGKIGIPRLHLHQLTALLKEKSPMSHWNYAISEMPDKFKQIHDECLSEACSFMKSQDKIRIITLVREPISRDYSYAMHILHSVSLSSGDSFARACLEHMQRSGILGSTYGQQFDWFDRELKSVFGVDVFAHPFDKETGYSIIKQDNVEVLIMKLEKLNTLESVIGKFVSAPNFKLINANESGQKGYKYFYKSLRETIKLPRSIFDFYYKGNPRVDHFYTEEEKASFIKKWAKNIED